MRVGAAAAHLPEDRSRWGHPHDGQTRFGIDLRVRRRVTDEGLHAGVAASKAHVELPPRVWDPVTAEAGRVVPEADPAGVGFWGNLHARFQRRERVGVILQLPRAATASVRQKAALEG